MRKKIGLLIISAFLLTLLTLPSSSSATAGDGWESWWFNQNTNELLRISVPNAAPNDYTLTQYNLSAAQTFPVDVGFVGGIAVSNNFERIAYCSRIDPTTASATTLVVFNPFTNAIELQIGLGVTAGCALSSAGFADSANSLAVGVLYDDPYNPQGGLGITWELLVIDVSSGQITNRINDGAVAAPGALVLPRPYWYVAGNNVTFYLMPVASGGPFETLPTYDWNLTTDSVQANVINDKLNQDVTTTDLVWIELDQAYPAVAFQGMGSPLNTIKFRNANGVEQVLANPANGWISSVAFIQNGQYIAYNLADGVNFNNLGWFALDQNGNTSPLTIGSTNIVYTSVLGGNLVGSPLGYIYGVEDNGQTTIYGGAFGNAGDTTLWVGNGSWQMISKEPLSPTSAVAFPSLAPSAVAQPAQPTQPPQAPTTCPGHGPTRMSVGAPARITEGPANSFRTAPSLNAERFGEIPGGAAIVLLEGPLCADGHTWWRVSYGGQEGWTSEGTGNDYWIELTGGVDAGNIDPGGVDAGVSIEVCATAGTPAFEIGDTFQVDFTDPDASLLLTNREDGGGGDDDVRAKMSDNDRGVILEGPVCGASGDRWRWRVRDFATGIEGWASQGVANDSWMCPLTNPECGD